MKLDLKLLAESLSRAEPGEAVLVDGCSAYLLDKVFRPISRGEHVRLRDLDYNRFDQGDLSALSEYNDALVKAIQASRERVETIAKIEPVPNRVRKFC